MRGTRFNEAVDQLVAKAARSYSKRVDQARDMFLAILSHDLRNPLNSIAMSAEVLPHVIHDANETRTYTTQIASNVTVMARMISDLLDYTRTRLGAGMPVQPAAMNLGTLGGEVFSEFHTAHPGRDLRFNADGDLSGEWDVDRLRQAISNLMGNAIQHGATDMPVELKVSGDEDDVRIEVSNGGPPIPPGELPKIFNPLIRGASAEHPKKNRPGSIGLGLYIAREVARSHGGRIDVVSTAASGTVFTVHLPRYAAKKAASAVMDETQIQDM